MQVERYMGRVSGPLLDRIDLHIEVPGVPFQELSAQADGTPSAVMRARRIIIFGSTFSGHAGTQTPLRVHTPIQPSASGVPASPRSTACTPPTTALLSLAGAFEYCAIGQTS